MINKIIRAIIFIAFISLVLFTHADNWLEHNLPKALAGIIEILLLYLPILFLLCYRSISPSLLASVAISLLGFISFVAAAVLWLLCFYTLDANKKVTFIAGASLFLVILTPVLACHFFGYIINWWINKMNPKTTAFKP